MSISDKISFDICNIAAIFEHEGLPVPDEVIELGRRVRSGEITASEAVRIYLGEK